jgi:hypothetical protein
MEISLQDVLALAHSGEVAVPNLVGKAFFFRTVTYHIVGRVDEQYGNILRLGDAAWIADSGRFTQAISEGKLDEVEPVDVAYVNLDSVTDFYPWNHALPLEQK